MAERDERLIQATTEANEIFGRLAEAVENRVGQADMLDVVEIATEAGLEIDDGVIEELQLTRFIPPLRFVPWHHWDPWRPLWCWWWRRHPWHDCCPYWWHGCHP